MSRRRYMMPSSGGGGVPVPTVWWDGKDDCSVSSRIYYWPQKIGTISSDSDKMMLQGTTNPHVVDHYHNRTFPTNAISQTGSTDVNILNGHAGTLEIVFSVYDISVANYSLLRKATSPRALSLYMVDGAISLIGTDQTTVIWNSLTDSGKSWGADTPIVIHITKDSADLLKIYVDGELLYSGTHHADVVYPQQYVGGYATDLYSFRVWKEKCLTASQVETANEEIREYYGFSNN